MEPPPPVREDRFSATLDVYLELHYSKPTARAEVIRRLIRDNPEKWLELPALDRVSIDSRIRDLSDQKQEDAISRLGGTMRDTDLGRCIAEHPDVKKLSTLLDLLNLRDNLPADLRNAPLKRVRLERAVLSGADLRGANLERAVLRNVNLEDTKLQEAELSGADFQGEDTSLWNADLSRANLSYAKLQNLEYGNLLRPPPEKRRDFNEVDEELNKELIEELRNRITEGLIQDLERYLGKTEGGLAPDLRGGLNSFCNAHGEDLKGRKRYLGDYLEEILNRDPAGESPIAIPGATNFEGACLRGAKLEGTDLSGCKVGGVYFGGARLDKTRLQQEGIGQKLGEQVDAECNKDLELEQEPSRERNEKGFLYGDERLREELKRGGEADRRRRALFFREAKEGYRNLKQNFANLGEDEASSWAYLKERRMEKREAFHSGKLGKWTKDWAVELICDYGEGPARAFFWILIVLVAFAIIYGTAGVVENDTGAAREPVGTLASIADSGDSQTNGTTHNLFDCTGSSLKDCPKSLRTLFLFSLGSMTTMEPDGLRLQHAWTEFIPRVEALFAIALTGLLGFVLGNRIRRR